MARIRTIKPDFPQSESMGRISREARLLFILLWTVCDDFGRTRGNSRILASLLYPYDDDAPKHIGKWLDELERENCIVRYTDEGNTYLEICNWSKHQKIDKITPSKLPAFREDSRVIREDSREVTTGSTPKGSGSGSGSGMEGKGKGKDMSSDLDIISPVLAIMNQVLGKNFKGSKESIANIKARIKEGHTLDDFEQVCRNMLAAWGTDPKMSQYLCPETLFSGKMDKYLNTLRPISPAQKTVMDLQEEGWFGDARVG